MISIYIRESKSFMKKFISFFMLICVVGSFCGCALSEKPSGECFDYEKHLGTWYYTPFSSPEPGDFEPLTITDKGNNKAEIQWYDGSVEEIEFVSDDVAHGNTFIFEECQVEAPSGLSEQRKNVPVVNVYDFSPDDGKESIYVCQRTKDTDRLVLCTWQRAVRSVKEVFPTTEE